MHREKESQKVASANDSAADGRVREFRVDPPLPYWPQPPAEVTQGFKRASEEAHRAAARMLAADFSSRRRCY